MSDLPQKPDKRSTLRVCNLQGEADGAGVSDDDRAFSAAALHPANQAGLTVAPWARAMCPAPLDMTALASELSRQAKAVNDGDLSRMESILTTQAHTLDAIFNDLARNARLNIKEYPEAFERFMRMAFRAQSQCRATIETIAEIKNPKPVAFVQQANFAAGHQQVNNGAARAEIAPQSNELLERPNNERLDVGTAGSTSRDDSPLASVVPLERPEVSRREGALKSQQRKARGV